MKGILIFIGMIIAGAVFCYWMPFVFMPGNDIAMALPVISVPGEVLWRNVPIIGTFTNTMTGLLITDVLILLLVLPVAMRLKKVPGRMQGIVELIVQGIDGLAKNVAGVNGRRLFPLAATIFTFLLLANWVELVPTVDSIGLIHCAEEGFNGYPTKTGPIFAGMSPGRRWWSDESPRVHRTAPAGWWRSPMAASSPMEHWSFPGRIGRSTSVSCVSLLPVPTDAKASAP